MIAMQSQTPSNAPNHTDWFKSSFSSNANQCVEVRFDDKHVSIRDSKFRRNLTQIVAREPIIKITHDEWATLLDELTVNGSPEANRAVTVELDDYGTTTLRAVRDATALTFTKAEWRSFLAGAHAGEFHHAAFLTGSH